MTSFVVWLSEIFKQMSLYGTSKIGTGKIIWDSWLANLDNKIWTEISLTRIFCWKITWHSVVCSFNLLSFLWVVWWVHMYLITKTHCPGIGTFTSRNRDDKSGEKCHVQGNKRIFNFCSSLSSCSGDPYYIYYSNGFQYKTRPFWNFYTLSKLALLLFVFPSAVPESASDITTRTWLLNECQKPRSLEHTSEDTIWKLITLNFYLPSK